MRSHFKNQSLTDHQFARISNGANVTFQKGSFSGFSTSGSSMMTVDGADLSVRSSSFSGNDHDGTGSGGGNSSWIEVSNSATAAFHGSDFSGNSNTGFQAKNASLGFTGGSFSGGSHEGSDNGLIRGRDGAKVSIEGATINGFSTTGAPMISMDSSDLTVTD